MQGPNYLDLAHNLAEAHYETSSFPHSPDSAVREDRGTLREWLGHKLINTGERLIPRTRDLRLEVSTGPPCP